MAWLRACAVAACSWVEVAGMGSRQQNLQSVSVLLFLSIQGEIQFPMLHFACQGATGLQGAASGWAAGLGGMGNARGTTRCLPAPHGLVFSTAGVDYA